MTARTSSKRRNRRCHAARRGAAQAPAPSTGDRRHRVHERVERVLHLRLGRLDHQRLGNDQREVTVDAFVDAMLAIAREGAEEPELLHAAPHDRPVRRLDEVRAVKDSPALPIRRPSRRARSSPSEPTGPHEPPEELSQESQTSRLLTELLGGSWYWFSVKEPVLRFRFEDHPAEQGAVHGREPVPRAS